MMMDLFLDIGVRIEHFVFMVFWHRLMLFTIEFIVVLHNHINFFSLLLDLLVVLSIFLLVSLLMFALHTWHQIFR